jgi:hypothetical protein
MTISRVFVAVLCAAGAVRAVETKTWQQAEMADFEKGTLTRLSLTSEGRITLAPAVKEVFDPSVTFLWAIARDSKGNLYAGGGGLAGSKAKLFVVDAAGKAKTLAELEGLAIQALAIDGQDRVYAATTPDGKVYRVDAAGKVETFYDPHAKYIWALAFSKSGFLYVATGDQGEIHRVTPAGSGSVFFRTEETHARSLAMDANDNLIVGTDPSGLVLRVTPAGEGFVLHQASKREITSVAVAQDGTIYAAGVGNKQSATAAPLPAPVAPDSARVAVSLNAINFRAARDRGNRGGERQRRRSTRPRACGCCRGAWRWLRRRGHRSGLRRSGRLLVPYSVGVNGSVLRHQDRSDLTFGRLMQHESLACRCDAQDQSAGVGTDDQIVVRVHGERSRVRLLRAEENGARSRGRHAMDLTLVARGDIEEPGL